MPRRAVPISSVPTRCGLDGDPSYRWEPRRSADISTRLSLLDVNGCQSGFQLGLNANTQCASGPKACVCVISLSSANLAIHPRKPLQFPSNQDLSPSMDSTAPAPELLIIIASIAEAGRVKQSSDIGFARCYPIRPFGNPQC